MMTTGATAKGFTLTAGEYFKKASVDVMAFSDFYPAGHQSGVTLIMNGKRIVANGDLRFEATPGQWQPIPKQVSRTVNPEEGTVVTHLEFPDKRNHLHGFNPMLYPDFEFSYDVIVKGMEEGVEVTVNMDKPVPSEFLGKLSFNLELFPGELFGKSYLCDDTAGVFPRQPNGPTLQKTPNYNYSNKIQPISAARADKQRLTGGNKGYNPLIADDLISAPYAMGRKFTICPEDELLRFSVESMTGEIGLYDGRMNHNNGWFVLSIAVPENMTDGVIHLYIKPTVTEDWIQPATVQISQVGYHTKETKKAFVELDARDQDAASIKLVRFTADGSEVVLETPGERWGSFLRYNYLVLDFTEIREEGLYQIWYKDFKSNVFRIARDIYDRGVWQPVVEYFYPVQMCHMRVNEKYRVWHGRCHCDDGRMAPLDYEHFDGAAQGPDNMAKYKAGEHVPGLSAGGWHDAGDFDLRIESQTGEMYIMSSAVEEFNAYIDETTIDQTTKTVEIHQPDGKNDLLQQIEHGAISVVNAYKNIGRLYRMIICGELRQYVLLGDAVNMTSGIPDGPDERLIFTEDNPMREFFCASHLAASYRTLKDFNPKLAKDLLQIAGELFEITTCHKHQEVENDYAPIDPNDHSLEAKIHTACELFLSTGEEKYRQFILDNADSLLAGGMMNIWILCKVKDAIADEAFSKKLRDKVLEGKAGLEEQCKETPYGIPYRPNIWGAGWQIQGMAFHLYYVYKAFPDLLSPEILFNALHFILGAHPGTNTAAFASGVGSKSATVAYGANRADWSYIPGGVISGTALIRPDLPELLEFPFLWQQTEYVLGGGSGNYMFLVLAVDHICKQLQ